MKTRISYLILLALLIVGGPAQGAASPQCHDLFSVEFSYQRNQLKVRQTLALTENMTSSELMEKGQVQEAAWIAKDAAEKGDSRQETLAQAVEKYLETSLLVNSSKARLYRLREGSSEVFLAEMPGGLRGIWKPNPKSWKSVSEDFSWIANPNAEVAAYEIDRALGLGFVPVTVKAKINGVSGSLQVFVQKTEGYSSLNDEKLQIFDYLINNWDRHAYNRFWFQSRAVAIDHGLAFQPVVKPRGHNPPAEFGELAIEREQKPFFKNLKHRLTDQEIIRVLSPYLPREIIDQTRARRVKLIQEFEKRFGTL